MKNIPKNALALAALTLALGAFAQEAAIRKNLGERIPQLQKIDEISKSAMPGLFELLFQIGMSEPGLKMNSPGAAGAGFNQKSVAAMGYPLNYLFPCYRMYPMQLIVGDGSGVPTHFLV